MDLKFIRYSPVEYPLDEMAARSLDFMELMSGRRSTRQFSPRPVPREIIERLVQTAASAPSGANKQPWTFVAVGHAETKRRIREAAEHEETLNYSGRMGEEWLRDLAPLGTNANKEFLEIAPWLIIVFKQNYEQVGEERHKHYYVSESVGLATGMLLAAIQYVGLCALTHTPSPMDFLINILGRPANERPFLLIPVGYAHDQATVPLIKRKALGQVLVWA
ncbi:MAG: nitroreductase family protein [Bacteroidetes bacterium]|jgi:nitroreductase|nr:nitroreductase family protein [Bacteroidota bacterium]